MQNKPIHLMDELFTILSSSRRPEKTLDGLMSHIANKFQCEVCSTYLYDKSKSCLILSATKGLHQKSVGQITMSINEGLTGLVIETMAPVFVTDPFKHRRNKFYQESGEEKYRTFLGLPLVYHQNILGVLVLQTVDINGISKTDIPLFSNIAGLIAASVAYTGLLDDLTAVRKNYNEIISRSKDKGDTPPKLKKGRKQFLRGMPISEGFADGYAHYIKDNIGFDQIKCTKTNEIEFEIKRIERAFKESEQDIALCIQNEANGSAQNNAILDVLLQIIKDPVLIEKIIQSIKKGYQAEYALKLIILEYIEVFKQTDNPYLWDRAADIEGLGKRVLGNLLDIKTDLSKVFENKTILFASDLCPVDLIAIRQSNLKGIVLAKGGGTSHTVIMAKSWEIPIIIGVDGIVEKIKQGDQVIIDGASGLVFSNPPEVIREEYQRIKNEKEQEARDLKKYRHLNPITVDGFEVKIGSNIGLLSDMENVKKYGADHIGLYRTEFPFLVRKSFPTEDDQFLLYYKVVTNAKDMLVTIRTFDVGGDKFLSYLDYPKEENPYLGWRSIRVSLDLENEFKIQIRSILKASAFGNIRLLFPMITSISEVKKIIAIVDAEKEKLRQEKTAFSPTIPIGIMVEVPGTVKILDRLLKYIDFVSIGTNDLVQYLLAVDRNNERVANLYNPLHPSVIETINEIVTTCHRFKKSVSICGEAAANPLCAYLFLGMGVDYMSMNSPAISRIKKLICTTHKQEAQKHLAQVLKMEEAHEIKAFIENQISN